MMDVLPTWGRIFYRQIRWETHNCSSENKNPVGGLAKINKLRARPPEVIVVHTVFVHLFKFLDE